MKAKMFKQMLLLGIINLTLMVSQSYGQKSPDPAALEPMACESNIIEIGVRAEQMLKSLKDDRQFIIIVARLGSSERSPNLNYRRLDNLVTKLKELGLPTQRLIQTIGTPMSKYGRVEIYSEGRLLTVLPVPVNADLCVSCCGPDERYYPEKSKNSNLRKSVH